MIKLELTEDELQFLKDIMERIPVTGVRNMRNFQVLSEKINKAGPVKKTPQKETK